MQPLELPEWLKRLVYRRRLYRQTFGTTEGRLVLRDLMRFAHYGGEKFVANDFAATAQLLGREQVVRRILEAMRMTEDDIETLKRESLEQEGGAYG